MKRQHYLIAVLVLCVIALLATCTTRAQSPTAADRIQDRAVVADQARQDRAADVQDEQIEAIAEATVPTPAVQAAVNSARQEATEQRVERIEKEMSGNQKFWIQIITLITGMITAVVAPIIAMQLYKAQGAQKDLAASINGVKAELMAEAHAAGYFEGVTMAKVAGDSPEVIARYDARAKEVNDRVHNTATGNVDKM